MSSTQQQQQHHGRERASSLSRSAIKQGYLYKRPLKKSQKKNLVYKMKPWKSRWFVLQKNCLYYFESAVEKEPLGSIPLNNVNIQMKESKSKKGNKFKFALVTPYATHVVAASSDKERSEWIEVIMTTCGANKLSTSIDYITKVIVTVLEAKFDSTGVNISNNETTECLVSVNTPFQQFSTVKKYKTLNPIFNEQFVFDCPRFPVEFYISMQVDTLQDAVFQALSENQLEAVAKRKLVKSNSQSGVVRMTLMEPQININARGRSDSLKKGDYQVERTGDFDLQMEGWFKVKQKEQEQRSSAPSRNFLIVDDTEEQVQKQSVVLGEVYLSMEYIFEDLSGFPISIDNLLYKNKEEGIQNRRKLLSRRYRQELERLATERNIEISERIENNGRNKLAELKDMLAEEEQNYKLSVKMMKQKEQQEKKDLEQRLAQEEAQRTAKLDKELTKQEKLRKKQAQEQAAKEALEEEQNRIAMMLNMKKAKEDKLKEVEEEAMRMEQEMKREIEERIRLEEEELRRRFEEELYREQEERVLELDLNLRREEEYKKKQLKRDIKNLEMEMVKTKEYMEMQELKKKNLDSDLKKEERKRMKELQKQIKKEELVMLQALAQKIKSEDMQRIKELEQEIDKIETEQTIDANARFNEERSVLIAQFSQGSGVPPPPPSSGLNTVWFGSSDYSNGDDDEENGPPPALMEELKFGTVRLKKTEVNAHKKDQTKRKPYEGLSSKLQETLLRRRQQMDSDDEKDVDSDDDYAGSTDSNNLLSIIAKKIEKIEKENRFAANNDENDDLFASDSDDEDW
jgi:hypothetical protein